MRENLYATFANAVDAQRAIGALMDHGADSNDLSLLINDKQTAVERDERGLDAKNYALTGITTTTTADAEKGAVGGAGIGFAVGALATLAALAIPGVGLVIGGGALAMAIAGTAGATAAGAVAGGVTGYLKDMGIPPEAAQRYHAEYSDGRSILSISIPSGKLSELEAREIIAKYTETPVEAWGTSQVVGSPADGVSLL